MGSHAIRQNIKLTDHDPPGEHGKNVFLLMYHTIKVVSSLLYVWKNKLQVKEPFA